MKLYGFNRQVAMPYPHNDAVGCFCGYFQVIGQSAAPRKKGMVAPHFERAGQPLEYALLPVQYFRLLAVHRVVEYIQFSAERFNNSLQSQADAKDWDALLRAILHCLGDSKVAWPPRARRYQYQRRVDFANQRQIEASAVSDNFCTCLTRVICQRVDKAIVVVNEHQLDRIAMLLGG